MTRTPPPVEPPGFLEAWQRLYKPQSSAYAGSRAAYARFFLAGVACEREQSRLEPAVAHNAFELSRPAVRARLERGVMQHHNERTT